MEGTVEIGQGDTLFNIELAKGEQALVRLGRIELSTFNFQ
jgi:hypothetical protein